LIQALQLLVARHLHPALQLQVARHLRQELQQERARHPLALELQLALQLN
jgi:hypothetical protein